jgi:hypothetical protein
MSHHLDTPLAAQNGQLFIDDLYVFPGDGSTVFGSHARPRCGARGARRLSGRPGRCAP